MGGGGGEGAVFRITLCKQALANPAPNLTAAFGVFYGCKHVGVEFLHVEHVWRTIDAHAFAIMPDFSNMAGGARDPDNLNIR